MFGNS
jgi:hypothetical protein